MYTTLKWRAECVADTRTIVILGNLYVLILFQGKHSFLEAYIGQYWSKINHIDQWWPKVTHIGQHWHNVTHIDKYCLRRTYISHFCPMIANIGSSWFILDHSGLVCPTLANTGSWYFMSTIPTIYLNQAIQPICYWSGIHTGQSQRERGDTGFQVTGTIERYFWAWNLLFRDIFG